MNEKSAFDLLAKKMRTAFKLFSALGVPRAEKAELEEDMSSNALPRERCVYLLMQLGKIEEIEIINEDS